MTKEQDIEKMELILKKCCGFDYDGYINSFNCYSGASELYEAGYRLPPKLETLTAEQLNNVFLEKLTLNEFGIISNSLTIGKAITIAVVEQRDADQRKVNGEK